MSLVGIDRILDFQSKCTDFLLKATTNETNKIIVVKAPTGSGKTIILLDYIDKYFNQYEDKTVFIWFSPGRGELEEQSQDKMTKHLPFRPSKTLEEALISGFEAQDVVFINWEKVNNKKNKATAETEKKNLYERIKTAYLDGLKFICIVDEEHVFKTKSTLDILNAFAAEYVVRVSATAEKTIGCNWYKVEETDVITEGLITDTIQINLGIPNNLRLDNINEHEYLIDIADIKRKEIQAEYKRLGKEINPMVLIQFPDMCDDLIEQIEELLNKRNYNYDNSRVAKWLSDTKDKINLQGITEKDAKPYFLIMKQAISTGWDCPRAKILIKLRYGMEKNFEIQTIGRIRRMPEAVHYVNKVLDNCYIYTFDEDYQQKIIKDIDTSTYVRECKIKDRFKDSATKIVLKKQFKNGDISGIGEREAFNNIYIYLVEKYCLTNVKDNVTKLKGHDYKISDHLEIEAKQGEVVLTEGVVKEGDALKVYKAVDTHELGYQYKHAIGTIASAGGLSYDTTAKVLARLFRKGKVGGKKVLSLNRKEYWAFIIQNEHNLKEEFRKEAAQESKLQYEGQIWGLIEENFVIPNLDEIPYDILESNVTEIENNLYENYMTDCITVKYRSKPEQKFELKLRSSEKVEFVYKNGDKGNKYFSTIYIDKNKKQKSFYPDYIIKLVDGSVWIFETKGGQRGNSDDNIDEQIKNKFDWFKKYADEKGIKWGFVRERNEQLYYNNTEYVKDTRDKHWKPLDEII